MKATLKFEVIIDIPEEYQKDVKKEVNGKYYFPEVIARNSVITEALNNQDTEFHLIEVEIN